MQTLEPCSSQPGQGPMRGQAVILWSGEQHPFPLQGGEWGPRPDLGTSQPAAQLSLWVGQGAVKNTRRPASPFFPPSAHSVS